MNKHSVSINTGTYEYINAMDPACISPGTSRIIDPHRAFDVDSWEFADLPEHTAPDRGTAARKV